MIKIFHKAVLLMLLGFFLMPSISFACEMKSEQSCCNQEMSSNSEKMDCCKKEQQSKGKKDNENKGKSKQSSCNCFVFHISVIIPFETESKFLCVDFLDKKDKFNQTETTISSGFSSIWLIPKIS
jgi:hypothetical protein